MIEKATPFICDWTRENVESEEVQPGIILDFDVQGQVVGFEMLELSRRTAAEQLRVVQVETT